MNASSNFIHENLKIFLKMVLEDESLGRCLYREIKALKGTITAMTEVQGILSASGYIKILGKVISPHRNPTMQAP